MSVKKRKKSAPSKAKKSPKKVKTTSDILRDFASDVEAYDEEKSKLVSKKYLIRYHKYTIHSSSPKHLGTTNRTSYVEDKLSQTENG